MDSGTSDIL